MDKLKCNLRAQCNFCPKKWVRGITICWFLNIFGGNSLTGMDQLRYNLVAATHLNLTVDPVSWPLQQFEVWNFGKNIVFVNFHHIPILQESVYWPLTFTPQPYFVLRFHISAFCLLCIFLSFCVILPFLYFCLFCIFVF